MACLQNMKLISWQAIPKTPTVFSTDGFKHKVVVIITYRTFDVDLMDLCRFTLGTILYKKVVPTM